MTEEQEGKLLEQLNQGAKDLAYDMVDDYVHDAPDIDDIPERMQERFKLATFYVACQRCMAAIEEVHGDVIKGELVKEEGEKEWN